MFGCCWLKDQLISWVTTKNRVICISYFFCQNLANLLEGHDKKNLGRGQSQKNMSWPFSGKLSAKCLAIFCSNRNVGLKDSVQSLQENIFQHSVALCSKIDQHGARFPPVSHMGHYASLAQKSMDSFVLVTAPLHFTSGGACAPPKHSW